jgi:hypothetical protein
LTCCTSFLKLSKSEHRLVVSIHPT